jgi:hypothetical protein
MQVKAYAFKLAELEARTHAISPELELFPAFKDGGAFLPHRSAQAFDLLQQILG